MDVNFGWCVSSMGDTIMAVVHLKTRKLILTYEISEEEDIDHMIRVLLSKNRKVFTLYTTELGNYLLDVMDVRTRTQSKHRLEELLREYLDELSEAEVTSKSLNLATILGKSSMIKEELTPFDIELHFEPDLQIEDFCLLEQAERLIISAKGSLQSWLALYCLCLKTMKIVDYRFLSGIAIHSEAGTLYASKVDNSSFFLDLGSSMLKFSHDLRHLDTQKRSLVTGRN